MLFNDIFLVTILLKSSPNKFKKLKTVLKNNKYHIHHQVKLYQSSQQSLISSTVYILLFIIVVYYYSLYLYLTIHNIIIK